MDIVRSKQKQKRHYTKWFSIAVISGVVFTLVVNLLGNSSVYHVDKAKLLTAEVQRGQFNVSVRGVGILVP